MNRRQTVTDWVEQYLAYRHTLGFRTEPDGGQLRQFAKYLTDTGHRGPLTTELFLRWVRLPQQASHAYLIKRLAVLRTFAKYLAVYEPNTEIPPVRLLGTGHTRPVPYIYSQKEIAALLRACRELAPMEGLRPQTYRILLGLIAATGLRVSEALRLSRDDVDLAHGVLTVRETKFHKSRLVPVHETTRRVLHRYADRRDRALPSPASTAFFLSEKGSALPYPTVQGVFAQLRRRLGWEHKRGGTSPRIHDLRHTLACRRLVLWYREGVDVEQVLPLLSTYLGHVKPSDTYWYLTGIPELLALTAKRFEHYAVRKETGGPS